MALLPGRALNEESPPAWLAVLRKFLTPVSGAGWGTPRRPVIVTSSNFGVGSLYAYHRAQVATAAGSDHEILTHAAFGPIHKSAGSLQAACGWGPNITIFSHACVSAHLGLVHAARLLALDNDKGRPVIDEVLVVSYDFLSPFVAGGFHSLKILNADFPAPYMDRATGSIALGDGAAYAVLTRDRGFHRIVAQNLHNEMYHFTANRPDGSGFAAALAPIARAAAGMRVWVKGHGTGTLEAGRLEATAVAAAFPDSPLVGWKGALGHTLGSCGLVELAIAAASMRKISAHTPPRTPGTGGTTAPAFTPHVATAPFDNNVYDGVVCASNAFGGAHAALLLCHA
jgi:3-oxoacyl-(acyl-carrier-protein) synthase